MTRSLAKFLIQYHYDPAERLPGWLRRWTDSDAQLRQFELELQNLERALSSQAESYIAFGSKPTIVNTKDAEVDANANDVKKRKRWMVSTLETTKRLASDLRSKSWQANDSMELAQQTIREEGERAREAGVDGLRFVTKTLPIATVRMIGMNSPKGRF